jgi:5'-nucleotidase / UDP-sugar diphosphatase
VSYSDPIEAAREQVEILRNQVDILIAVTHLSLFQDQQLAAALPDIDLILGGHEHENVQQWRLITPPSAECPTRGTPIFKADANARTVYVHNLYYDTETDCLQIESDLQPITAALTDDPRTARVVEEWVNRGFEGFRASGFEPEEVVATTTEWLDGLEAEVRSQPTNLTQLIAQAMLTNVADAELAIFNGGSIRIDDRLPPGPITQYDVIRILPFGGKVLSVDIPGSLLQQVFDQGQMNRGTGGYLQTANVSQDESGQWLIQNEPLDLNRTYRVAINDFLISGREQGLSFFTLEAPGVELIAESDDIRFAVIRQLRQLQSQSPGF